MIRKPKDKVIFSTRWFDDEADQSDRPPTLTPYNPNERREALAQRQGLAAFLRTEAQARIASA
jgi:hypothetical protein